MCATHAHQAKGDLRGHHHGDAARDAVADGGESDGRVDDLGGGARSDHLRLRQVDDEPRRTLGRERGEASLEGVAGLGDGVPTPQLQHPAAALLPKRRWQSITSWC
jgi:hypothetical protein